MLGIYLGLKGIIKLTILAFLLLVVFGFIVVSLARNNGLTSQQKKAAPSLSGYLNRSLVGVNTYISGGVVPPTNKWFSSLAFKQPSNPIFAWPLALRTTTNGFVMSQPQIIGGQNSISAPFTNDITAILNNKISQTVTGYDDLSVMFDLSNQNKTVLSARLTRGSPYLFTKLQDHQTLTLNSTEFSIASVDSHSAIFSKDNVRYGVVVSSGANVRLNDQSMIIDATNNMEQIAIFALPVNADFRQYSEAANHPLSKTQVSSSKDGDAIVTKYSLQTTDNKPTLFGLLPFAYQDKAPSLGSFSTLEGTQVVKSGNDFSFSSKLVVPDSKINLDKITADQRDQLEKLVTTDSASLALTKDDSYFGGKELYRAAQLLQLAKQLGLTEPANHIQLLLKNQLNQWFDPSGYKTRDSKYFYYDNGLKGLVATKSDFGSDAFNDHHFHYGYYLVAASVLANYDQQFLKQNKIAIDNLAKDISNIDRNDPNFPYLRTFDAYVGHSWASGFADFNDGQNQESSSEAVNAWYGAYQWGKASGNSGLADVALTLYNRESQAANNYSLNSPGITEYTHKIVPLIWSGKLDYATFFSDTPEAKLGIQLIPMSPGSNYLNGTHATSAPANLTGLSMELAGRQPTQFKDYITMYGAMYEPKVALSALNAITPKDIDDGNSMSYLYAWIYSQQNQ